MALWSRCGHTHLTTTRTHSHSTALHQARLTLPNDVACTRDGKELFVADWGNHRIRHITLGGASDTNMVSTLAGSGTPVCAQTPHTLVTHVCSPFCLL